MDIIGAINSFAATHPWVGLTLAIYLVAAKAIVGVRDAIDKTPATDDNIFERIASIVAKTIGYLGGIRPKQ